MSEDENLHYLGRFLGYDARCLWQEDVMMFRADGCRHPWHWTQGSDTRQTLWGHLEMTGWGSSGGQRDHRSLLGNGRRIFGSVAFAFHIHSVGHQGLIICGFRPGERREGHLGGGG